MSELMSEKLKPCPFCGGEASVKMWCEPDTPYLVMCESCKASVKDYATESEAIEAWNQRAERTAKVVDTWKVGGYDELNAWCPECGHRITRGCSYCPTCGAKLDWSENE